ncbi:hypothetical protein [uncultured Clostridium sp.]|uniref:hypothetical protein n=1 Tax=uncultured Clostridium sp. TaxID=59620 RepID=UPI002592007A|nr:hypothetical protein [uncultured Clostridium sp.]
MNQEMAGNLQDLRDIRRQMDFYYGIGQEYFRQKQLYQRYEKSKEKWAPKNKVKYIVISLIVGVFLGPIGWMFGILVALGLFFFYSPISNSKKKLCDQKQEELNAILERYREAYEPVAEKCERLLLNRDEYNTPMSVDYLIRMIETGRVDSMKELYDKMDEQLHRWTMEKLQKDQLDVQMEQSRQLREISKWQKVHVAVDAAHFISSFR